MTKEDFLPRQRNTEPLLLSLAALHARFFPRPRYVEEGRTSTN